MQLHRPIFSNEELFVKSSILGFSEGLTFMNCEFRDSSGKVVACGEHCKAFIDFPFWNLMTHPFVVTKMAPLAKSIFDHVVKSQKPPTNQQDPPISITISEVTKSLSTSFKINVTINKSSFCNVFGNIHGGFIASLTEYLAKISVAQVKRDSVQTKHIQVSYQRPLSPGKPYSVLVDVNPVDTLNKLYSVSVEIDSMSGQRHSTARFLIS